MRSIRTTSTETIAIDPKTGQPRVLSSRVAVHSLGDQGGIDSREQELATHLDCGCERLENVSTARCHACGALGCESCHFKCPKCRVPVCGAHSRQIDVDASTRHCRRCTRQIRLQRLLLAGCRLVGAFFVESKGRYGR